MMNIRFGAFFAIMLGNVTMRPIFMATPLSAMAAVGELDPLFGSEGQVRVSGNFGPHLLELPDGRPVVSGR